MGLVFIVVVMAHAHHFGELLEGEHAVAVFVKGPNDEVATWHTNVFVFHSIDVLDEVLQFLKGEAAAVVSIGFVEHGHQHLHHVAFKGFFERRVLLFVVVLVIVRGLVFVVLALFVVVLVVIVVVHVPCHPELIPGKAAVVVRIEF